MTTTSDPITAVFKLVADLERQLRELREDADQAKGDLNECANHLGIELLPQGLGPRIHGFTLAVKGLVADARRDELKNCLMFNIPEPHREGCESVTADEEDAFYRGWDACMDLIRARLKELDGGG